MTPETSRRPAFSVVTPTLNPGFAVRRAHASVAGQAGVGLVEHLILDGASSDGTVEWLQRLAPEGRIGAPGTEGRRLATRPERCPLDVRLPAPAPCLRWLSEPDQGMYDALNKGFNLADGDVLAWLNADEQYLPGTLAFVVEWFAGHPDRDVLFGDHLIVDEHRRLLARRRMMPVRWPYVLASHLYGLSCAMFFRRRVWDAGIRFDPSYRSAGDADWVARVLRAGFRAGTTSRPLAAFTLSSGNLSRQPAARQEERRLLDRAPTWVRRYRGLLVLARRAEMAVRGSCRRTPQIECVLFDGNDSPVPRRIEARNLDWRWPGRPFTVATNGLLRPQP